MGAGKQAAGKEQIADEHAGGKRDTQRPPLPRMIGLLNCTGTTGEDIVSFIFDDLADAFAFYAAKDAYDPTRIPYIKRIDTYRGANSGARDVDENGTNTADARASFDALVLGVPAYEKDSAEAVGQRIVTAVARANDYAACTRIYAVLSCENNPIPTWELSEIFEALSADDRWYGCLAVDHARRRKSLASCPRMGAKRRGLSEAIDWLILCIRCGEPVGAIGTKALRPWQLWKIGAGAH